MRYGRPLGPHPVLLRLLADRIAGAGDGMEPPPAVLVVGRGSTDPDANADVCKVSRLLWEGRDYEFTETAFVSLARPGVAEGLERCRRLGARRIVLARYFLFPGVLPDRITAQAEEYAAGHPGLEVRCTDVLGDCPEIAALVAERYREALAGDIRMNCDMCVYRTAMPGFAHRVGAPQHPHDHPDDHDDGHGHSHGAATATITAAESATVTGRACRWCPLMPFRSMRAETCPADARPSPDAGLAFHGDRELADGLVDLAVNVRPGTPPPWLADRIHAAVAGLAAYPDPGAATEAVARRHDRPPAEVLVTAGAAEAFTLVARAFRPRRAVIVHPQFTEPEAALRAAGHPVERVTLGGEFRLDPAVVPDDADLVVIGNPTNPTSVLHPAAAIRALARPGRLLLVDEAFADCVPGEPESLAGERGVPGLIVVRSLTKTWGLAGLRAGDVLAGAAHVDAMAGARPPWAVSTPALAAVMACCEPRAQEEATAWAGQMNAERDRLAAILNGIPGVVVTPGARASFLLLHVAARGGVQEKALVAGGLTTPGEFGTGGLSVRGEASSAGGLSVRGEEPSAGGLSVRGEEPSAGGVGVRERLRGAGFAVRRGDTFPGLGPDWLRVAVRDRATNDRFADALRRIMEGHLTESDKNATK